MTKETASKKQELSKKNTPNILTELTDRFERLEEMDVDGESHHKTKQK